MGLPSTACSSCHQCLINFDFDGVESVDQSWADMLSIVDGCGSTVWIKVKWSR